MCEELFTLPLGVPLAAPQVMYKVMYNPSKRPRKKDSRTSASPLFTTNSGGRIRTSDLRVMGPTSYQTALPRGQLSFYAACLRLFDRAAPVFVSQSYLYTRPPERSRPC